VGPGLKSDGEELFHWFMNQSDSVSGFTKAIWSGVTTIELAKAVKWSIENNITGLYHITNNHPINKNELLKLFNKYTNKGVKIIPVDGNKSDKSFIDTRRLINYQIPSYDQMVMEMVKLIINNKNLYAQYYSNITERQ
jgi:dTDP-4-dehydrorhamnose reductase